MNRGSLGTAEGKTLASFWKESARRGDKPRRESPATAESQAGHTAGSLGEDGIRGLSGTGGERAAAAASPPAAAGRLPRTQPICHQPRGSCFPGWKWFSGNRRRRGLVTTSDTPVNHWNRARWNSVAGVFLLPTSSPRSEFAWRE